MYIYFRTLILHWICALFYIQGTWSYCKASPKESYPDWMQGYCPSSHSVMHSDLSQLISDLKINRSEEFVPAPSSGQEGRTNQKLTPSILKDLNPGHFIKGERKQESPYEWRGLVAKIWKNLNIKLVSLDTLYYDQTLDAEYYKFPKIKDGDTEDSLLKMVLLFSAHLAYEDKAIRGFFSKPDKVGHSYEWPYQCIGHILWYERNHNNETSRLISRGTGVIIGQQGYVLTTAQCLQNMPDDNGTPLWFVTGISSDSTAPFPRVYSSDERLTFVHEQYYQDPIGFRNFNVGLFRTDPPLFSSSFGVYALEDDFSDLVVESSFYPTSALEPDSFRHMYTTRGKVTTVIDHTQTILSHNISMPSGQSGAPLYIYDMDGMPLVIGLHVPGKVKVRQGFYTNKALSICNGDSGFYHWLYNILSNKDDNVLCLFKFRVLEFLEKFNLIDSKDDLLSFHSKVKALAPTLNSMKLSNYNLTSSELRYLRFINSLLKAEKPEGNVVQGPTQELEEWEKDNLKDYFSQPILEIIHLQRIADNYHSEKEDLTEEDFEEYKYATVIGNNFLRNHSLLKSINCNNFSFVTEIGDGFLSGCAELTKLDLSSLIYLKNIGNNFLYGCYALMTVDLSGLSQLTIVRDNFLLGCNNLRMVDLSGLSQLTIVRDNFLYGCNSLTTVDLSGLNQLTTVGDDFLSGCDSLTTVDLSGLSQLTTVGDDFLSGCDSLTTVDLSGLSQLTTVGDDFLSGCHSLTMVDLSRLGQLTTVGPGFIHSCSSLMTVDLSGLGQLTTVGDYFLFGCSGLKTVDFSGLCQLTTVGKNFLSRCSGLQTVDLSELGQLTAVGDYFLFGCSGLKTVDFSGLCQLTTVGDYFLAQCLKIRSIHFGDKLSKVLVQKTIKFLRNSEIPEQQELGVKFYQTYLLKLPQNLEWALSQINLGLLRDRVTKPLEDLPHLLDADVPQGFNTFLNQMNVDLEIVKKYEKNLHPILQHFFENADISIPWLMYEENRGELKIAFKHILKYFQTLLKDPKGKEEVASLLPILIEAFNHCQSRQATECNSLLSKIGFHLSKDATNSEKLWHLINDYKQEAFNSFSANQDGMGAHTHASQFTVINNCIGLPVAMRTFDEKIGKLSEDMIKELLSTFIQDYFNPALLIEALYQKSQEENPLLRPWEWRGLILEQVSEEEKAKDQDEFFKIISGCDQEDFDATTSPITRNEIRYLLSQIKLLDSSQEQSIQEIDFLLEKLKPLVIDPDSDSFQSLQEKKNEQLDVSVPKFSDQEQLQAYFNPGQMYKEGQLLTSDVLSSDRGDDHDFPFVAKDLRSSESSLEYIMGPCPGSYDALAHIGVTRSYEGTNESTDKIASGASLDIARTCSEEGKCLVMDSQPLATEEKKLQGDSEHRTRITDKRHPFHRIHGHLIMKFPENKTYTGSGILVGPHHVLTAAHNLYNPRSQKWATEVFFAPGRNEGDYPYADSKGSILLVHQHWHKSKKPQDNDDLGMVILDSAIGLVTGWSGLLSLPDILLREWPVSVTGYPGEKGKGKHYSTQMWTMSHGIKKVTDEKLFYEICTTKGQSGSGIWGNKWPGCDGIYTVGVHTGTETDDAQENRGVRLSQDKFNLILHWLRIYQLKGIELPSLALPQADYSPDSLHFLDDLCTNPIWESQVRRAKENEKEALYQIGCLYANGEGDKIQKNPSYAFACFYRSAELGYPAALTSLGVCYETGQGIAANKLKAISFYEQAKKKGDAEAFHRLGLLYLEGKLLPKKPEMAINHLEAARKIGDPEACFHLSELYEEGIYVNQDIEKAEQLYALAKKRGCDLTRESTRSIYPLSKEERRVQAFTSWKLPDFEKEPVVDLPDDFGPTFIEAVPAGEEESYLVKLGNLLHDDKEVAITNAGVSLSGMGGVGKSSLALRYAHLAKHHHVYDLIVWWDAESKNTLIQKYRQFIKTEGCSGTNLDTEAAVVSSLSNYIKGKGYQKYLFIYDNVPYPKGFIDLLPQGSGHYLMTSRCRKGWVHALLLDVFSREESIDYLMRTSGIENTPKNRDLAGEIAEEVGDLPLALDHVGSYLEAVNTDPAKYSFSSYLKKFRTERDALEGYDFESDESDEEALEFAEAVAPDKSKQTVATTWRITMEQLTGTTDPYKCRELMMYCSYLAPHNIPIGFFKTGVKKSDKKVETGLSLLSDYSMLKRTDETVSVHRLVQWVIRNSPTTTIDISFFDNKMPEMILNYIQRSFTPSVPDEKIWGKTLNIIEHSAALISNAKQRNYKYKDSHSLLSFGRVMNLGIYSSLFTGDPETLNIFRREISKTISIFFRERILPCNLRGLENRFKGSHPIIHHSFGMYYLQLKDYKHSLLCFTKAAEMGFPQAQYHLGFAYYKAQDVEYDLSKAIFWWTKAAEQEDVAALYNLGLAYKKGKGVEKNDEKTVSFWTKAAKKGHPQTQFMLGILYATGDGVEQNDTQAAVWLTKAAEMGHTEAQFNLGLTYTYGKGVEQNHEKAVQWYQKAAEQEHAVAQYQLGLAWFFGKGVAPNKQNSKRWLVKSAKMGNADASKFLLILSN